MSIAGTIKMTAKQYLALGEDPPGIRLELVDGEIAVSPSPTPDHGFTVARLVRILDTYVDENDLGQVFSDIDTVFDQYQVRRPDVLFFGRDRLPLIAANEAFRVPPDLAVEVISPSGELMDRQDKFDLYQRHEVAHYWIIDPIRHTAEAYVLQDSQYIAAGDGRDADVVHLPPFPDLALPLAKLWRPTVA